jgi:CubicO group peptidase (beta-lactamase class C family)
MTPTPLLTPVAAIGDFPRFPGAPLPESVADSLQAALDGLVEDGTIGCATAAVVVGGSGTWSGASGLGVDGKRLTRETPLLTASVAKTVTAALSDWFGGLNVATPRVYATVVPLAK